MNTLDEYSFLFSQRSFLGGWVGGGVGAVPFRPENQMSCFFIFLLLASPKTSQLFKLLEASSFKLCVPWSAWPAWYAGSAGSAGNVWLTTATLTAP